MEHQPVAEEPLEWEYNGVAERKKFHETKAGVKGLADSGITKIPRMFIHDPKILSEYPINYHLQVPLVDLEGLESNQRLKIVEKIGQAAETWGFFQVINHGVPGRIMDDLLESAKRFHEQPSAINEEFYSQQMKMVRFYSNDYVRDQQVGVWKDSYPLFFQTVYSILKLYRKAVAEYVNCMIKLKDYLSEVLSEALGLSPDHFSKMECTKSAAFVCHYSPPCPEPHLTLATTKHSDPNFLTILLQDIIGGLQILHDNHWVDVPPTKGALIVNIGDLLQLVSNDKFKSAKHRVMANSLGPRLSAACFFSGSASKTYGPIKQLLSAANPTLYREIRADEIIDRYRSKGIEGMSTPLPYFKI